MSNPTFSSMEALRSLYEELSFNPVPYYKTLVRVRLPKKAYVERSVVHLRSEHADLSVANWRGAVAVDKVRTFKEINAGALYVPATTGQTAELTPEMALIFKIDCDLARKKTGSIDPALAHYIADSAIRTGRAGNPRKIQAEREKLERARDTRRERGMDVGGRPRKYTNSQDLLARYGKKKKGGWDLEDEVTAFILANAETLDASTDFAYDEYRDPVMANRIDGVEDLFYCGTNMSKLAPDFGFAKRGETRE